MKKQKTFYFALILTPIKGHTTYTVSTSPLYKTKEEALNYMNRYPADTDHIIELVERELAVKEFDDSPTKIVDIRKLTR